MDTEALHELIAREQPNICQIAAYKGGAKLYSDCWNGYKTDDCTHIMSATKSIMSLLVGIALDKGQIQSIDDKVLDYFPEYTVKRGEKTIHEVTIRHLLTMTAPYKCRSDPWTKVCSSDNWTYASLDFLGGRKGLNRRVQLPDRLPPHPVWNPVQGDGHEDRRLCKRTPVRAAGHREAHKLYRKDRGGAQAVYD